MRFFKKKRSAKTVAFDNFVENTIFKEICFRKPTVSSCSFTFFDICAETHVLCGKYFEHYEQINDALEMLVIKTELFIESFDPRRLNSISASSTLSKYPYFRSLPNVDAWLDELYEADNMGFSTDEHFEENEHHVRRDVTGRSGAFRVSYYDWHNRLLLNNAGGSHHTLALIKQLIAQPYRVVNFSARKTNYKINAHAFDYFKNDFYCFIANSNISVPDGVFLDFDHSLSDRFNLVTQSWAQIWLCGQFSLFLVERSSIDESIRERFSNFMSHRLNHEFIDAFHFLENADQYLT